MSELNGKSEVNENPENSKSSEVAEANEKARQEALAEIDDDLSPGEEESTEEFSEKDREELKSETGWSDEIVDSIDTKEQAEIYKNADLHESNINGRECLVKDIDYDYVDEKSGMTNRERMALGRSPYDSKNGEKIELHHMGQDYDSPFAELDENSEHGDGNHSILHPTTEGSWRNDEGLESQYNSEKQKYWKARSEE